MADVTASRGLVARSSPFSYEETVQRLVAEVRRREIDLFAQIDHSSNADRAGLQMPPAVVLIFGNPTVGTPLMVSAPDFAIELPSRALVRAEPDGSVVVVHFDAVRLAAGYGIDAGAADSLAGLTRLIDAALADPKSGPSASD